MCFTKPIFSNFAGFRFQKLLLKPLGTSERCLAWSAFNLTYGLQIFCTA